MITSNMENLFDSIFDSFNQGGLERDTGESTIINFNNTDKEFPTIPFSQSEFDIPPIFALKISQYNKKNPKNKKREKTKTPNLLNKLGNTFIDTDLSDIEYMERSMKLSDIDNLSILETKNESLNTSFEIPKPKKRIRRRRDKKNWKRSRQFSERIEKLRNKNK